MIVAACWRTAPAIAQTAADLGKSPYADRRHSQAGNADGSIPAWTGGLVGRRSRLAPGRAPPRSLRRRKAAVLDHRRNMLRAIRGQAGRRHDRRMLKTLPSFRVDVYPTHRTFAAPQFIYDNAIANASRAHLAHDGQDVEGAARRGAVSHSAQRQRSDLEPHPALARLRRDRARWPSPSPRPPAITRCRNGSSASSCPTTSPASSNDRRMDSMYWSEVVTPAAHRRLITLSLSYQNPVEQPRTAWQYYPGERRVRRAPGNRL